MTDGGKRLERPDEIRDCDVAIIGAGPSGLVAASLLGKSGHRVVVVERYLELYGLPRLSHIDGETARIVQSCGDVEAALRDAVAIDKYDYRDADGNVLIQLDWSGQQCGFPAHISIFQPDIESAIYQSAQSEPNVTFLRGYDATTLTQNDEGVTVTAKPWSKDNCGGQPVIINAKFLIGADGANSFVRRELGIGRFEYGFNERWLNLDSEYLRDLGGRFDILTNYCDPARGHMFMPIGKSRVRFEVRLLPGESTDHWENIENGWAWLAKQHALGPDDIKPIRNIVYTFDPGIAESWQQGRIFLVGDAAHTMMPYMGQGACSGMRDGANIAWKLDLVLRGKSDASLLGTYEEERRPHVTQITEMALFLGQVANEDDPEKVAIRNAMFLAREVPPMPPFPKVETGVVRLEADGRLAPTTGAPAPQGTVRHNGTEGRLDDLTGGGFVLVCHTSPTSFLDPNNAEFLAELGCNIVVFGDAAYVDVGGDQTVFMESHDMAAYLRRPDFSLFGSVARMEMLDDLVCDLREKLHWRADHQNTDERVREAAQ